MGTMLIVNAVLLLGIASESKLISVSSSFTSNNPVVVATTSKSKRDLTTQQSASNGWSTNLNNQYRKRYAVPQSTSASYEDSSQSGTTVNTISGPSPSQSVTYNPRQYYQENPRNIQRQEQRGGPSTHRERIQTTSALPALQGGFQASPENAYPINPSAYATQPNQRFQKKVATGGSQNSQYFSNPSTYKHIPETNRIGSPTRGTSFTNSGGNFSPFQKFKSLPTAGNQYPATFRDHSFENLPKLHINPSSNFNPQGSLVNAGQLSKGPYRGSSSYPGSNNLDITGPAFSSEISNTPNFKSFDKLSQNYQYGSAPGGGYTGKKLTHPVTLQLPSSPDVSGFVPVFDSEPALLSTGINYQAHPSSGLNFDFPKAGPTSLPDGSSAPFSSTFGNYQTRFVPGHSSSSAPRIPHYKGSGANTFGSNEFTKPDGGYQLLANQPQLHFTTGIPLKSGGGDRPSVIYHTKPFDEIRTDVEVINKKKPTLPLPDDSDEHDFDEGFKTSGGDFDYSPVDSGDNSRPTKGPEKEMSFDVPNSNLFNSYDEAFGKYSKLASREENTNEKLRPLVHHTSKPVYQSIEVEEDDGNRDKSSEEYTSSYTDGEVASGSYEDEDEQESRRTERHESERPFEDRNKDADETASYKSYGEDYEKEFEDSYRKELPKNNYVHVKEVPEIEEQTSESKKRPASRNGPKTSRGGTKQKSRRVVQDTHEAPKEYQSYATHEYEETPRSNYRDNEGHGSRTTYTTTSSSESPAAQSYGYKIPHDRGTLRYGKKDTAESRRPKDEATRTRNPSDNPETQSRSYKASKITSSTQKPVTLTVPTFESIKSYTYPPFSSQKSGSKLTRDNDSYGAPTYGVPAIPNPETYREGLRYFANGQFARDFSGI